MKKSEYDKTKLISEILKAFEITQVSDLSTYAKRWDKATAILNKYLETNQ